MKKMKIFKSVLLVMLVALLLATTLVSCGNKQTTAIDTSIKFEDSGAEQYFARILNMDATAKQNFIAAFRGYDVHRASFNDAEVDPTKAVAVDMTLARSILAAATQSGVGMVAGLTPEDLTEILRLVALDNQGWSEARSANENWYTDARLFLACLMRGHSEEDNLLAEGADVKGVLEAVVNNAAASVASLTAGQLMDIHYWANTNTLGEAQWKDKLVSETEWSRNGSLYYADMLRRAGKTAEFAAVKLFVTANALGEFNAEDIYAASNIPTFSYTDADGVTHNVSYSGDGYVLAINTGAMQWAVSSLRPTDRMHAERFDQWLNELSANPERVATVAGAIRVNQDLSADKFPQILLVGIGRALGWMTKYLSFNNYVIGLLWFAILVEAALIYFSIRQQKNSIKQAKLSPKERAIRKKYEGRKDQPSMQKMNEEIQKLYQEEGFNPMGGCLPLLIQMPIVIFLYQIVIDPLRYMLGMGPNYSVALSTFAQTSRAAGGLGLGADAAKRGTISLISRIQDSGNWDAMKSFSFFGNSGAIHNNLDFNALPNFRFLGMDTGFVPSEPGKIWPLILVPILTFVAYFLSMKFSRKMSYQPAAQDPQMGCSNNMMDITMPLMSVYIAFITPAAIGIYWIFKCLTGMLKQYIMSKAMPLPTFTEEDYKKADKEMRSKNKNKPDERLASTDDGRVYRSLHHIDDDEE